ncbi:MAG TPA: STN domain-containing protein, partial [Membranihabitans sp.]|nr:STN domain-containing protein [Membranihabitans sp.]
MNWSLMLLFFLCILRYEGVSAAPGDAREMKFLDAIKEISENFNVYFSFDREIVKDLTVHYESEKVQSLEEAVHAILEGTDLQYKLFDERFVIIYKKDLEGIRSIRKMVSHME